MPESQWSAPLELVLEDEGSVEDEEGEDGKLIKGNKTVPPAERRPTGKRIQFQARAENLPGFFRLRTEWELCFDVKIIQS